MNSSHIYPKFTTEATWLPLTVFFTFSRFGKKKDEKSGKAEQKGATGSPREEELEKVKEERER